MLVTLFEAFNLVFLIRPVKQKVGGKSVFLVLSGLSGVAYR